MKKRVKTVRAKDNFEAVYLRHCDFKKINALPKERLNILHLENDHNKTLWVYSQRCFSKHRNLLTSVGLDFEDILSISRIHLYKYLVLYSLKNNEENLANFIKTYKIKNGKDKHPTLTDITKKDASNFMTYLSQRLSDLVRLCNSKVKNINGMKQIKAVFELPLNIDESVTDEFILENYEKIGAKRLTLKQVALLRQSGANLTAHHFIHENKLYRSIMIKEESYTTKLNCNNTLNLNTYTQDYESLLEAFDDLNNEQKRPSLKSLIRKYKKLSKEEKKAFLEEQILIAKSKKNMYALDAAKKLLSKL